MAEILVREIDETDLDRLRVRARARNISVEALAREAIQQAAKLTVEEKQALVRANWAKTDAARIPGALQTPGWVLIREDRDSR